MTTACQRFDSEGVPRLVAGEPPDDHEVACAGCQRARSQYLDIIDGLAQLPSEKAPDGWQERVLQALPADSSRPAIASRNWPVWTALAAAAAILLWRIAKPEPPAPRLAVKQEVVAAAAGRRADSATIGDAVRVVVTGGAGQVREARLYRDTGELVARCKGLNGGTPQAPSHASCVLNGSDLELTVTLTASGSYRTLAIVGPTAAPEPSGSLDEDARAAAAAGASVELSRAIDVE
jgi:hypothetical protein